MEYLKLEKSVAIKIFGNAPEFFQQTLISTFGKECFSGKIIDRIKTFQDACIEANVLPESIYLSTDSIDEKSYKKLKLIISVINEGWVPDWNDSDQKKWYPWFQLSSGFGFSGSGFSYDYTTTAVGSRLCFETKEKCEYVAQQFIDLYKDFLT